MWVVLYVGGAIWDAGSVTSLDFPYLRIVSLGLQATLLTEVTP